MLDVIVMALIDCVFLLGALFFVKSIFQHGIIKGFWRFCLLIEGVCYVMWRIYSKVAGFILEPIVTAIFWPFEKFWGWAKDKKISLVIYLAK